MQMCFYVQSEDYNIKEPERVRNIPTSKVFPNSLLWINNNFIVRRVEDLDQEHYIPPLIFSTKFKEVGNKNKQKVR